ncbi:hypothetical protein CC1G_04286 [Coprinopsis cinerea okayama7|uniref:Uncharacterized protein n=1 Tax=Coprinopsis cinerea (strain Okayama-7 / 130 / ATCC MYA-4618 / FGSC 9003) TaxID=240176 RepID=A8NFK3_COPC7|nr:hypothetical protein CC1G_04286 [Coprinopsis cinerea okayama7\|eukprot:XP_001833307.1 hypothetical protein CC1G_04286 [Coprinopsis cinerea okayama7\
MAVTDLSPLQLRLQDIAASLKQNDSPESWRQVEQVANAIANGLRVKDEQVDNHTNLGKSALPQCLTDLITLALHGSPVPADEYTTAVFEILRIAANLCLDHDANRGYLLDAGLPQAIVSLLEGYADKVPAPTRQEALSLSLPHLRIVRTAVGVLLNASIGYDAVRFRLISLESALTLLKLSSSIYPPLSWHNVGTPANPLNEDSQEEWALRSGISNWAWRTISELKEAKDDPKEDASRQILNVDVLPWITPALSRFIPPYNLQLAPALTEDEDFYTMLVQSDFEVLEETCTLLESLSLDVEDIRLALARGYCFPAEHLGVPCFKSMVEFIEHGGYPPTWDHPSITPEDRARKEKTFNICKAALIKSVVEVAGEEKNEDVLWDDSMEDKPGGEFVWTMARWIKEFNADMDIEPSATHRDDLVICAALSLGNLARREKTSTALLSPPLSLAPVLASKHIFAQSTDVKLKHGVLGLLKHVAQSAALSPIIPDSLAECHIVQLIAESGIWDEGSDNMAIVVQLNAIGVVKHLCNASVTHALALVAPGKDEKSPLDRILALVSRSDSIPIKSEGVRVLVNVIRTLLMRKGPPTEDTTPTPPDAAAQELAQRKQAAIAKVLTESNVKTLAWFLARSGKFPILINEGIVALNLLVPQKDAGNLVLNAILTPENTLPEPTQLSPSGSDGSSPTLVNKPRPPVARHGLEMIVNVLRNTDNPAVYPVEIRANVCTFLAQLSRYSSGPKLVQVQEAVRPVLDRIKETKPGDREEMLLISASKVLELWKTS